MTKTLLCLGYGYSAQAVARLAMRRGWRVKGTTRSKDKADRMEADGVTALYFGGKAPTPETALAIASADAIVVSIAPDESGDPVLLHHAAEIARARYVAYLSTVGVYGDHGGNWVDETSETRPVSKRSVWRCAAEAAWESASRKGNFALDIFRLAGIYGPGRNTFRKLKDGTARALVKPGQVFNRIHVADIAAAVTAGIEAPGARSEPRIFNVSDDEPSPPQDALWYAADLAGLPRPPAIDFETADLTPMARSFYGECKRVRNARLKDTFGFHFRYPTYREGLGALWASGEAD